MEKHNVLYDKQYGLRKKHPAEMVIAGGFLVYLFVRVSSEKEGRENNPLYSTP